MGKELPQYWIKKWRNGLKELWEVWSATCVGLFSIILQIWLCGKPRNIFSKKTSVNSQAIFVPYFFSIYIFCIPFFKLKNLYFFISTMIYQTRGSWVDRETSTYDATTCFSITNIAAELVTSESLTAPGGIYVNHMKERWRHLVWSPSIPPSSIFGPNF